MLDILKFIFSSFWVFSGTIFLIMVCGLAIFAITSNFKRDFSKKEIKETGNISEEHSSKIQEDPRLVNYVEKGLKVGKKKGN